MKRDSPPPPSQFLWSFWSVYFVAGIKQQNLIISFSLASFAQRSWAGELVEKDINAARKGESQKFLKWDCVYSGFPRAPSPDSQKQHLWNISPVACLPAFSLETRQLQTIKTFATSVKMQTRPAHFTLSFLHRWKAIQINSCRTAKGNRRQKQHNMNTRNFPLRFKDYYVLSQTSSWPLFNAERGKQMDSFKGKVKALNLHKGLMQK